MTIALTVDAAAAATHSAGIPSPVTIVLVIAAICYVLWSRMQGRPLQARRLLVLPLVLTVLGIFDLTAASAPHLAPKDIAFLAASITLSVVLGAARGATIELYPQQDALWQRYRRSTVALWVVLITLKIVLAAVASFAHAQAGGGTNSLMLSLGLSLLAEAAIVGPRALSTGLPFAPHDDNKRQTRSPQAPLMHNQHRDDFHSPRTRNDSRPDAPARWSEPEQSSDRRRPERRRPHQGPIHRLLDAGANQQRNTRTRINEQGGQGTAGQGRSPSVHDGINWLRDQSGGSR
ncbi:MAG: hypothetical protein ABI137_15400 [Antricoccus sp.]